MEDLINIYFSNLHLFLMIIDYKRKEDLSKLGNKEKFGFILLCSKMTLVINIRDFHTNLCEKLRDSEILLSKEFKILKPNIMMFDLFIFL